MLLLPKLTFLAPVLLLAVKVSALPPAPAYQLNSRGGVNTAADAESPRQVIRVEAPAAAGAAAEAAGRAYLGPPNGNGNATLTIPHAVDGDHAAARRDRDRQRDLRKVNAAAHRPAAARDERPTPSGPDAPPTDDTSAALPGGINHPRATGGCHQQQKRDNTAAHDDDDFASLLASRAGAATKTATTTTKFRTTPNPRVSRDSISAYLAASYEQHYGRKLSSTSGEGEGGGPIKVKEGAGLKGPANGKKSVEEELQRSYEEHFRHAPGKGKGHKGEEV